MGGRGGSSHGGNGGRSGSLYNSDSYKAQVDRAQRLGILLDIPNFVKQNVRPANITITLRIINEFYNKVPEMRGFVNLISTTNGDFTYASMDQTGVLRVGMFGRAEIEEIKRMYANDVKTEFHPYATTYETIIQHELGHAMEVFAASNNYGTMKWGIVADKVVENAARRLNNDEKYGYKINNIQDVKDFAMDLSRYAVSKIPNGWSANDYGTKADWATWETLAEGVGDYLNSDDPHSFSKYIWEEIVKEVKKH